MNCLKTNSMNQYIDSIQYFFFFRVSGCVGFGNYKFFFLFVLYTGLYGFWMFVISLPLVIQAVQDVVSILYFLMPREREREKRLKYIYIYKTFNFNRIHNWMVNE